MTVTEFIEESVNYRYSAEFYNLQKESSEVRLAAQFIESREFAAVATDTGIAGEFTEGYLVESADDIEVIREQTEEKKKNLFQKIWEGIKKIAAKFVAFLQHIKTSILGIDHDSKVINDKIAKKLAKGETIDEAAKTELLKELDDVKDIPKISMKSMYNQTHNGGTTDVYVNAMKYFGFSGSKSSALRDAVVLAVAPNASVTFIAPSGVVAPSEIAGLYKDMFSAYNDQDQLDLISKLHRVSGNANNHNISIVTDKIDEATANIENLLRDANDRNEKGKLDNPELLKLISDITGKTTAYYANVTNVKKTVVGILKKYVK